MYLKYYIICTLSCLCHFPGVFGQQPEEKTDTKPAHPLSDLSRLTPDEYKEFKLPPLQVLLDNAQKNPQILQSNAHADVASYDLKMEKRKWLSYLSAHAGYNYGILGTYSDFETERSPLTTTYSGASQSSYSVGANLSIPFDDLLSRGTSVKKQRKILEQAEYNKEIVQNMVKSEIVDLYSNTQAGLNIIKLRAETLSLYSANYKITENDFMNGKATPQELANLKYTQQKAIEEYETMRATLNSMILKLEILTGYKLINK